MKTLPLFVLLVGACSLAGAESGTSRAPVSNFKLPTFTKDGHRSMLLQGTEAVVGARRVELTGLNLSLFAGDASNQVETIILSPTAVADLEQDVISGPGVVRFIRDDLEITGTEWRYDHRGKKVSITRNSRVVFQAQMPDILK